MSIKRKKRLIHPFRGRKEVRKDSERMWLGESWGPYKTKGGSARSSVSPVETLLPVVISSSQAPSLRASAGEGGPATKAYDLQLARGAAWVAGRGQRRS